ncbi:uncharacterized protein MONBRDRAFT_24358 [Monosiga brevicollis MX1]|uniref:Uncharacterized protein n=1 Tax=Monosiga brevicollis TaxID=81824 RepID=A9UW65_MONBE|nr:uncharacterized protein MONBRDRAFT_24358 [Monosiga brevicollis MX1]EDQ90508.1 predicted protein [Monosiga brevicollis MX1]|eukprot:XP_001744559.1 hypothetical protein [Monosiga brevicollis MX1]
MVSEPIWKRRQPPPHQDHREQTPVTISPSTPRAQETIVVPDTPLGSSEPDFAHRSRASRRRGKSGSRASSTVVSPDRLAVRSPAKRPTIGHSPLRTKRAAATRPIEAEHDSIESDGDEVAPHTLPTSNGVHPKRTSSGASTHVQANTRAEAPPVHVIHLDEEEAEEKQAMLQSRHRPKSNRLFSSIGDTARVRTSQQLEQPPRTRAPLAASSDVTTHVQSSPAVLWTRSSAPTLHKQARERPSLPARFQRRSSPPPPSSSQPKLQFASSKPASSKPARAGPLLMQSTRQAQHASSWPQVEGRAASAVDDGHNLTSHAPPSFDEDAILSSPLRYSVPAHARPQERQAPDSSIEALMQKTTRQHGQQSSGKKGGPSGGSRSARGRTGSGGKGRRGRGSWRGRSGRRKSQK